MRLETRGPQEGICNLCGSRSRLTEDHIPPKGVPRVGQIDLVKIVNFLQATHATKEARHFQRGIKYRSLCNRCNNVILGAQYDPDLVNLTREVFHRLNSQLYAPIRIECRINRVIRSLIGHFLACGIEKHKKGAFNSKLTDFFSDISATFPENYQAHIWLYPYREQITVNGAVYINSIADEKPIFFAAMKFFPIGFLICDGGLPHTPWKLTRLDTKLSKDIDDKSEIELEISVIPNPRWPEAPNDLGAVVHVDSSTAGRPR